MALFKVEANKTYASKDNAIKAVVKSGFDDLRYFIMTSEDNRYFPVFVGQEPIHRGVHFHFNVVG